MSSPFPGKLSILVMDNARTHHGLEILEFVRIHDDLSYPNEGPKRRKRKHIEYSGIQEVACRTFLNVLYYCRMFVLLV